jgi:hypothetical protein
VPVLARWIERAGIPTVVVTMMPSVAEERRAPRIVGTATDDHLSVMGYQDRSLQGWRERTAPELIAHLRDQNADGLILAPA